MDKKHILYFLISLLCIFSIEYTFNFTHLFIPKINIKETYSSSNTISVNFNWLKNYLNKLNIDKKKSTGRYKISKFAYNSLCGL